MIDPWVTELVVHRNAFFSDQSSRLQLPLRKCLLWACLTLKVLLSARKLSTTLLRCPKSILTTEESLFLLSKFSYVHLHLTLKYKFYILFPFLSSTWGTAKSLTQIWILPAKWHIAIRMQLGYKFGHHNPQHLPQQSTICANCKILDYSNNLMLLWSQTRVYMPRLLLICQMMWHWLFDLLVFSF